MASLTLARRLDLLAAAPLQAGLLAARGDDLELDAAFVEQLGGQCLQVLLAARASWLADGKHLRVCRPSHAFSESIAAMGAEALLGQEV